MNWLQWCLGVASIAMLTLGTHFLAVAQAPVIGQGGAAPGPPFVFRGPHALSGGGQPTITSASGCGTPGTVPLQSAHINGTDTAGNWYVGSDYTPATFCHIKFHDSFPNDPSCSVLATVNTVVTALVGPISVTVDMDELIISNATPNTIVDWICIGIPPGPN